MSFRERLDKVATPQNLFPELTNAQREANRILVTIANQISQRRRELQKTQSQLARLLSVSQPMVCQWESGECNFTITTLAEIFDKLNLKVDITFSSMDVDGVIPTMSQYERTGDKSISHCSDMVPEAA